jgi:putative Mg2+ transporter-C (MgtC) family protein
MASSYEVIFKLLLGTLLGGVIGFERQSHGRPAGFRTHLLVCVACVLIMIISEAYYSQGAAHPEFARVDPTRIAAGAMTGIGFLGAGVILKTGYSIQGLTTAASIWILSAIGLAVGAGQYVAGITGFIITFLSLWVLRILETRIPRLSYQHITIVSDDSGDEKTIREAFGKRGFTILRMDYDLEFEKKEKSYLLTVANKAPVAIQEIIEDLEALPFIKKMTIRS